MQRTIDPERLQHFVQVFILYVTLCIYMYIYHAEYAKVWFHITHFLPSGALFVSSKNCGFPRRKGRFPLRMNGLFPLSMKGRFPLNLNGRLPLIMKGRFPLRRNGRFPLRMNGFFSLKLWGPSSSDISWTIKRYFDDISEIANTIILILLGR